MVLALDLQKLVLGHALGGDEVRVAHLAREHRVVVPVPEDRGAEMEAVLHRHDHAVSLAHQGADEQQVKHQSPALLGQEENLQLAPRVPAEAGTQDVEAGRVSSNFV